MSRLTSDIDKIQQALSAVWRPHWRVFYSYRAFIGAFVIDWRLALASLVITPLALIPLATFSRQLKKKGLSGQRKMAQIYNLIHETISGNEIIKSFTTEEFEIKKFLKATLSYFQTSIKLAWHQACLLLSWSLWEGFPAHLSLLSAEQGLLKAILARRFWLFCHGHFYDVYAY